MKLISLGARCVMTCGALAAVYSLPAAAQDGDSRSAISHTYIEAAAFRYDVDTSGSGLDQPGAQNLSSDGDGYSVKVSAHIPPFWEIQNFAVVAQYDSGESDEDVDYTRLRAGLKYFYKQKEDPSRFTLFGELKYEDQEFESAGMLVDNDGYSIGGGWRFYATDRVEIELGASWVDLGEPQGFRLNLGAAVELPFQTFLIVDWENQSFSQDFDTREDDSVDDRYRIIRLGVRKAFDF